MEKHKTICLHLFVMNFIEWCTRFWFENSIGQSWTSRSIIISIFGAGHGFYFYRNEKRKLSTEWKVNWKLISGDVTQAYCSRGRANKVFNRMVNCMRHNVIVRLIDELQFNFSSDGSKAIHDILRASILSFITFWFLLLKINCTRFCNESNVNESKQQQQQQNYSGREKNAIEIE